MKKKAIKARFLSAILTCTMLLPTGILQATAAGTTQTDENNVTDDLAAYTIEAVSETDSETDSDDLAVANGSMRIAGTPVSSSTIKTATAANETDYDEDIYASSSGYEALDSAQKRIYDGLKEAAHAYYIGEGGTTELTSSSGVTMLCLTGVSTNSTSMSVDDIAEAVTMFRNDNPIYFFLGSGIMYGTTTDRRTGTSSISTVYLSVDDEFTTSSVCQEEREIIETAIAGVVDALSECETALSCAQYVHDWIANSICYAYDENNNPAEAMVYHSIAGVFDKTYGMAVCEGYAKAFQLLLNAVGIDNYYIVGIGNDGGHAWNIARMDDGFYYYFDVTWDDSSKTTRYFAAGETSFSTNHTPDTIDDTGWDFLYDLPDVPDADYDCDGTSGTAYTDGDFSFVLYEDYAVLTDYLGGDTTVTVPDMANGLPVTQIQGAFAGNSSLQEVTLPDTITVISYGEDSLGAFEGCASLKEINITDSITAIYYDSFYYCSALEEAVLPDSVTRIGARAYAECASLNDLYIYGTNTNIVSASSVYANTVIHGYSASTAEVYADTYDREFQLIEAATTEATTDAVETTTEETTTTTITTTTITTTTTTTTTTETTTSTDTETMTTTTTTTASTDPAESTTLRTATPSDVLVADLDGSGTCSLSDVILMDRYLMNTITLPSVSTAQLDCYQDNVIDIQDSTTLLKFLLRIIDTLPVIPE